MKAKLHLTSLMLIGVGMLFFSCKQEFKTFHDSGELNEIFYQDKDGNKHGEYKRYLVSGELAEQSHFKHGKQDGKRILFYPNGNKESESDYIDDKLTGKHLVYYDTGELMIDSDYKESSIVGTLKKYYKNGNLMEEVTFADDLENGPFKEYYEDGGLKWKGQYLNGDNEFGILEHFDKSGELIKRMECDSLKICKTLWEKEAQDEE